tara:strand:- start:2220 stop:2750 length:531 start_codon:yes stop_codon:yes gene_type:complete
MSAEEYNVREFLTIIGEDPDREGLKDTPKRVIKAWNEMLNPEEFNLTVFDSNGYDEMIVERELPFYTFCEHHLLPFFGSATIGYIPDKQIVGISKLARTLDYYARRLNTQEYLTQNIADYLNEQLKPLGVGVVIRARHLCQEMRGVKKRGEMVTSALKGLFLEENKAKMEFFGIIR